MPNGSARHSDNSALDGARPIDHVAIAVADIDLALPYFMGTLGLPLVHDERLVIPPVRLAYLDTGNTYIQLVQPLGPGTVASFLDERGEGLHHICFAVDSIEAFLETTTVQPEAAIFGGGRGRRACFLRDQPSGVVLEVTEVEPVVSHVARS